MLPPPQEKQKRSPQKQAAFVIAKNQLNRAVISRGRMDRRPRRCRPSLPFLR